MDSKLVESPVCDGMIFYMLVFVCFFLFFFFFLVFCLCDFFETIDKFGEYWEKGGIDGILGFFLRPQKKS